MEEVYQSFPLIKRLSWGVLTVMGGQQSYAWGGARWREGLGEVKAGFMEKVGLVKRRERGWAVENQLQYEDGQRSKPKLPWLQWNQDLGCGQERLMSWGVGWGMVWTPWYITAIQALWMLVSGPFTKVIFCKGFYVHPTFPDPLTNKDSPHPPACQFSHLEDQRVWRFFSFKIFLMTGGRLL